MEDEALLTPREEILIGRAIERFWLKWWLKKNPSLHPQTTCVFVTADKAHKLFEIISEYLKHLVPLLKVLALPPKFCNGLIGVSLTDSLPAPAVN